MAKPKRRRDKPYRPREQLADPVSWAIAGSHTYPVQTQRDLVAPGRAAYDKFRTGQADRDDWNMLCQCLNVAQALANDGIGPNLLPFILAGFRALEDIADRMKARRGATCYATELSALDEALIMYATQLKLCTQAEYSRAIKKVKDTIRSGGADDVGRLYEQLAA